MSFIQWRIGQYLKFYNQAETLFTIHSPFVFRLLEHSMDQSLVFYNFQSIELMRLRLLENNQVIHLQDYGTGTHERSRTISQIAANSLSSKAQCEEMHRVIHHLGLNYLLELGTSLGISAAYLASAAPKGWLSTLEGDPQLCDLARANLHQLDIQNVEVIEGTFQQSLGPYLNNLNHPLDFVFIDGHHSYEATMQYYHEIKDHLHFDSCVVIDDIYWSPGMFKAWEALHKGKDVTVSINRYDFGMLFFKKEIKKPLHLKVIDSTLKPWKRTL